MVETSRAHPPSGRRGRRIACARRLGASPQAEAADRAPFRLHHHVGGALLSAVPGTRLWRSVVEPLAGSASDEPNSWIVGEGPDSSLKELTATGLDERDRPVGIPDPTQGRSASHREGSHPSPDSSGARLLSERAHVRRWGDRLRHLLGRHLSASGQSLSNPGVHPRSGSCRKTSRRVHGSKSRSAGFTGMDRRLPPIDQDQRGREL